MLHARLTSCSTSIEIGISALCEWGVKPSRPRLAEPSPISPPILRVTKSSWRSGGGHLWRQRGSAKWGRPPAVKSVGEAWFAVHPAARTRPIHHGPFLAANFKVFSTTRYLFSKARLPLPQNHIWNVRVVIYLEANHVRTNISLELSTIFIFQTSKSLKLLFNLTKKCIPRIIRTLESFSDLVRVLYGY